MATQWTAGTVSGQVLTAGTLNTIGAIWEDYIPTLTQGVAVTKTTIYARWARLQKIAMVEIFLNCTSTGTAGGIVTVGLPLNARQNGAILGSGLVYDSSANFMYNILPVSEPTLNVFAMFYQTGNSFGFSPAITLTTNDQLRFKLIYEVA